MNIAEWFISALVLLGIVVHAMLILLVVVALCQHLRTRRHA